MLSPEIEGKITDNSRSIFSALQKKNVYEARQGKREDTDIYKVHNMLRIYKTPDTLDEPDDQGQRSEGEGCRPVQSWGGTILPIGIETVPEPDRIDAADKVHI